jgi:hypothetical protein
LPALSHRLRLLFLSSGLLVLLVIFLDNVRGSADIHTPLSIAAFVFATDTVQLRNTCLLNVSLLMAKVMIKSVRRPRQTTLLCTNFDIQFEE